MHINPIFATDFYKIGHINQYPEGTEQVYSNLTFRSAKLSSGVVLPDFDNKVVFFGLQGVVCWLLETLWNENFFNRPKNDVLSEYYNLVAKALGPQAADTSHIESLHDLGYLPIRIKALPEGSRVNIGVPVLTITNTLPEFFWLTNFLETQLSAELWKSTTAATIAFEYRRLLERYAIETGSNFDFVSWQGHDFSARGMSGIFDGAQTGGGHLLSFTGTDSVAAIDYLETYYGSRDLIGGSVPATEHSVMCMGGQEDEIGTFARLITTTYPDGIVSIVSDTWDFWRVITVYAKALHFQIMARNGKVVFRPDSGDPVKIICGDPDAEPGSPEFKGAIECLWDIFGGTITKTGYNLLDSHVGLIYGDSITIDRAQRILAGLKAKKFASGNIVFGIGSFTYQHVTRDTFGAAVKATFGVVLGEDRVIYKDPVTDVGKTKKSARGLLRVEKEGNDFVLYDNQTWGQEAGGAMVTYFEDGDLQLSESLDQIRARLHA